MNQGDKRAIWNALFGALGISAAGFYFGLRRLVWVLWFFLSACWIVFWLWASVKTSKGYEVIYLLITFGPPILVFFVVLLLQGIMEAFAGVSDTNDKKSVDSGQNAKDVEKR